MGRVSRYKRLKAVDPFNRKTGGIATERVKQKFDLPPSAADVGVPPRPKSLHRPTNTHGEKNDIRKSKSAELITNANHDDKNAAQAGVHSLAKMRAQPGESLKSFQRRVNAERAKQLTRLRENTHVKPMVRDKRKAYLKQQRDKRRGKGAAEEYQNDMESNNASMGNQKASQKRLRNTNVDDTLIEFPKAERFAFGERVEEPPQNLPMPRQPKKLRVSNMAAAVEALNEREAELKAEKTKEINQANRALELRKARLLQERDAVRAAYGELKKRRRRIELTKR